MATCDLDAPYVIREHVVHADVDKGYNYTTLMNVSVGVDCGDIGLKSPCNGHRVTVLQFSTVRLLGSIESTCLHDRLVESDIHMNRI